MCPSAYQATSKLGPSRSTSATSSSKAKTALVVKCFTHHGLTAALFSPFEGRSAYSSSAAASRRSWSNSAAPGRTSGKSFRRRSPEGRTGSQTRSGGGAIRQSGRGHQRSCRAMASSVADRVLRRSQQGLLRGSAEPSQPVTQTCCNSGSVRCQKVRPMVLQVPGQGGFVCSLGRLVGGATANSSAPSIRFQSIKAGH